jgi:alpha-tubulin suppressor-like RCC1 family protein
MGLACYCCRARAHAHAQLPSPLHSPALPTSSLLSQGDPPPPPLPPPSLCAPPPHLTPRSARCVVGGVAAGPSYCAAFSLSNDAYTWGDNTKGQLAVDGVTDSPRPHLVLGLRGKKVTAIACGVTHTLAVADFLVYSWGTGELGQLGLGPEATRAAAPTPLADLYDQGGPVSAVFAGPTSSFAVCSTTSAALGYHLGAFAWGDNRLGQLAMPVATTASGVVATPARIKHQFTAMSPTGLLAKVAPGRHTSYFVSTGHVLYASGRLECLGSTEPRADGAPVLLPPFAGEPVVVDVATRGSVVLAVAAGRVWSAGKGPLGTSLADEWPVLQPVPALDDLGVDAVFVGDGFCFARTAFGELFAWGR